MPARHRRVRAALMLAALVLPCLPVQAYRLDAAPSATPDDAAPPVAAFVASEATMPDGRRQYSLPMAKLVGDGHVIRLPSIHAETHVSLPIPQLWQAEAVRLHLVGTASRALIELSQLEVAVNGRVVHQYPLGRAGGEFRFDAAVPVELLQPGFNDVRIAVSQHYADRCEDHEAPQLWTDIDVAGSGFVLNGRARPLEPRLDRLDALFDRTGLDGAPEVPVLTAAEPSAAIVSAAGLVAQGIGQRYDYVPVRLDSGRYPADPAALVLPERARGAVLLGTRAALAPYLDGLDIPADAGPVAAIRSLPGDPTRFLLLFAAATDRELPTAATAFALSRLPWPARPWVAIRDLRLPSAQALAAIGSRLHSSTAAIALSTLGYATTTYSGERAGGAHLRFWISSWQARAQVRLHLNYASGMSPRSALNVVANGITQGSIPLNDPAGGAYDNYAVGIPGGALRPGWNTIELRPVLVPVSDGGDCKPIYPGNLSTTLYEDSTLQVFDGSPLKRPDLEFIARDGRSNQVPPAGAGLAMQLTDAGDETLGAGLTLMAKLTQVFHGPLLQASFEVGADERPANRIWIGPLGALPPVVKAVAGLNAGASFSVQVPVLRSVQVPVLENNDTLATLLRLTQPLVPEPETLRAAVTLDDPQQRYAVAATGFDRGLPLTVFTAATPKTLLAGVHDIVDYGHWAQLRGGRAFWRPGDAEVHAITADDAPFVAYSLRGGVGLWVSQYPWWSLLILLSLIAVLVLLTRVVLAGYRRRNLPVD